MCKRSLVVTTPWRTVHRLWFVSAPVEHFSFFQLVVFDESACYFTVWVQSHRKLSFNKPTVAAVPNLASAAGWLTISQLL